MNVCNRNHVIFLLSLVFSLSMVTSASAQDALKRQLAQSRYLTFIMKPDSADMGMTRWLQKKTSRSRSLPLADDFTSLQIKNAGTISISKTKTVSGKGSVVITTPTSLAVKNPSNRSYAFAEMVRPLQGEDLRTYNRLFCLGLCRCTGLLFPFRGLYFI